MTKRSSLVSLYAFSAALLLLCSSSVARAQQDTSAVLDQASSVPQKMISIDDKPAAPDFTLTDTSGQVHTLSNYRGKRLIINFWAVWCRPCRKEMPSLQQAWQHLQNDNYIVLAVNWGDDKKSVGLFVDSMTALTFPLLLGGDEAIIEQWSVRGLPTTFVIDTAGRITHRVIGDFAWDSDVVLSGLRQVE